MKIYALQARRSDGKWIDLAGHDYDTRGEVARDYYEIPAEDRALYRVVERRAGRLKVVELQEARGQIRFKSRAVRQKTDRHMG